MGVVRINGVYWECKQGGCMKLFTFMLCVLLTSPLCAMKKDVFVHKNADMPFIYYPAVLLSQVFDCLYEFDAYCESQKVVPGDVAFFNVMQEYCGESFATGKMFSWLLEGAISLHEERLRRQDQKWKWNDTFCCSAGGVLSSQAQIVTLGDLHGSVHSLARTLMRLQRQGVFDASFHLAPDVWLVVLGDVGDRGFYSLETWIILLSLLMVNPDRVVIIQGNHETKEVFQAYGFHSELLSKLGASLDTYSLIKRCAYFFSLLPQSLFLGIQASEDAAFRFIQFCHGGIGCYVKKGAQIDPFNVSEKSLSCIEFRRFFFWLCRNHYKNHTFFFGYGENGVPCKNGLNWNGFYANPSDKAPMIRLGTRGIDDLIHHGRAARAYLNGLGAPHFSIDAIIRGHDHLSCGVNKLAYDATTNTDFTPLLEKECIQRDGVDNAYTVYTLTSVPQMHPYDSYAILSFDVLADAWEITPYVHPVVFSYTQNKGPKEPDFLYKRLMKIDAYSGDFEYYAYKKIHQGHLP